MGSAALDPLTNKAIEAALANNWSEAIALNVTLLEKYPNDIETLNRLARAYFESGRVTRAKTLYKTVLKLDPYNPIASKNVKKLTEIKSRLIKPADNGGAKNETIVGNLFLEEPGKTKVMKIVGPVSNKMIAHLRMTDPLTIEAKYNSVTVKTAYGKTVGNLDPAWSKRIAKSIRAGSKFEAFVISVDTTQPSPVTVFIRETEHDPTLKTQTTFPLEKTEDLKPHISEEAISSITAEETVPESEEAETAKKVRSNGPHTSLELLVEKEQQAYEDLEEES